MKKALIDTRSWTVVQIIEADQQEFETTSDFIWKPCSDRCESAWIYDNSLGEYTDPHAHSRDEFGNPVEPFVMQRMRSYPPMGDQLDMLFKEIKNTGVISTDGEWFKSIQFVKDNIAKPGSEGDPDNYISSV